MLLPTEKKSAYAMQVAVSAVCGRRLLERLWWEDSLWSLHPDLQLFIPQPARGNRPFWVPSCHLPSSALCHLPSWTRDRCKGASFLAPHYHRCFEMRKAVKTQVQHVLLHPTHPWAGICPSAGHGETGRPPDSESGYLSASVNSLSGIEAISSFSVWFVGSVLFVLGTFPHFRLRSCYIDFSSYKHTCLP